MTDYNHITYTQDNDMAIVMLNRPKSYNALDKNAKKEIRNAVSLANKTPSIHSIILTGKGKAFCSGQDLNDRSTVEGKASDLGETLEREWNPLIRTLRDSNKIIIAAVNGVTAGAGLSIVLACDLIVAAPKVKFVSGFSKLGLAPDAGSSFAFTKGMGYRKSLEFFLLGHPLISEDLLERGIINLIDSDPLKAAQEMAKQVGSLSLKATELTKKNLQRALEMGYDESLERETQTQRYLGRSWEHQEGLKAFFEKRQPLLKQQNQQGES